MDNFSLEEDDGQELFLTQRGYGDDQNTINGEKGSFLGDRTDFTSPCVSLISGSKAQ